MSPIYLMLVPPALGAVAIALCGYLALRAVRAIERRTDSQKEQVEVKARIHELEQQTQSQAERIQQLAEAQRFTEQMILSRAEGRAEVGPIASRE